jgi:perosamine synthetase
MEHNKVVDFIKQLYPNQDFIPLHAPSFIGNEKQYLNECIDSTFVSYVGRFVNLFEEATAKFTGAKYAIATSNGTAALHIALILCDVKTNDEVICPALTFVASVNAIAYCNAHPLFADSDVASMGIDVPKLEAYLSENTFLNDDGFCVNKNTKRIIKACMPMHTFGHPVDIEALCLLCNQYNIVVVEDSAESLGSFYNHKHTGTFGKIGILSYNGNKTITTGGGGMILLNDETLAKRAKHITTTAKVPHPYEFVHDEIGYNYRLTNVGAAIGLAQMETIDAIIKNKRETAHHYSDFFSGSDIQFFNERKNCISNYWLNVIILKDRNAREAFLKYTNANGVMSRPIWTLMNKLNMFKDSPAMNLDGAQWLEDRVVNIPSSYRAIN